MNTLIDAIAILGAIAVLLVVVYTLVLALAWGSVGLYLIGRWLARTLRG
jgi:hypothetical protein